MIHLVVGSTGAGKTTYAIQLAKEKSAVRFAIDEWMNGLFFPDLTSEVEFNWAMERITRCEDMIWLMAERIIETDKAVVLEVSASTKALRKKQLDRAKSLGVAIQVHYLDVDKDIRRQRVRQRNQEKNESYSFEVNEEMFDFVEDMFELPDDDELKDAIIIRT